MTATSERNGWKSAVVCITLSAAMLALPKEIQSAIRTAAADVLRPGHLLVNQIPIASNTPDSTSASLSNTDMQSRVEALELSLRRQQLRHAELFEELQATKQNGVAPFVAQSSKPLLLRDLINARVLGRERDLDSHPTLLLDLGSKGGALREAFVVYGSDPIIDQGSDVGIAEGQPVYAGRCVLGRITRAGRWSSAVQLITDKDYSGRAQLLRDTEQGVRFGAEGILRGLGNGKCELTGLSYTEPVNVGDSVYTGGRSARFPSPMYYGKVISAELESGQRWKIVVEPHANADSVRTVAVLRESMNTTRVLGQ